MTEKVFKKKRVSKKTKQSWRKHVDIKDVDAFLEDKRLDERLGAPFPLRADSELFHVDTQPDDSLILTAKQKKRLALKNAPLKCFAMLESTSKVPDPISKRNRVRSAEERRDPITKQLEKLRRLRGVEKVKDKVAKQTRLRAAERKENNKIIRGAFKNDLWSVEDVKLAPDTKLRSEWLNCNTVLHTLNNTGKKQKLQPKNITKKQSVTHAVELPHPGMSYNPSFRDHQELLNAIAEKERGLIKEEAHLNRVTKKMFSRVSQSEKDNSWLNEMSEGLPKPDQTNNNTNESDSDGEYKSLNPPVRNNKKDTKQKRKQKEQRALKHQLKHARMEKKKVADLYKLRFLKKNLEKTDEKVVKLQEIRQKVKTRKSLETKTLGPLKFEAPELEFNLGKDISGNLRNIKKEGNVLRDRFKSLQKRNIIEPTVQQGVRRRTKIKRFTRNSHKA